MPKSQKNGIQKQNEVSQWIFLAPENAICSNECSSIDTVFIKISHPRSSEAVQFLVSPCRQKVFEVLRFKEEPRSWFVEDSVQRDGSLFVVTPIDPLFLVLPYFEKLSQKFRTLEQVLEDDRHPSINTLTGCLSSNELLNISDVKRDHDLLAYRLNNDKTIAWLKLKVKKTADCLSSSGINASKGSQNASFVRSKRHANTSRDDYERYAFGLVSDYLSPQWSERLRESLRYKEGITDDAPLSSPEEPPSKRARVSDEIPEATEDYSKEFSKLSSKTEMDKTGSKLTAAQKSLSKVDKSGMKSISSFFGGGAKKTKKK